MAAYFEGAIDMRSSCLVAVSLYLMGATVALAQTTQRTEGPGLKAQEDSRYKAPPLVTYKRFSSRLRMMPLLRGLSAMSFMDRAAASISPVSRSTVVTVPQLTQVTVGARFRAETV